MLQIQEQQKPSNESFIYPYKEIYGDEIPTFDDHFDASCTNCLASGQCNDGYTLKGNTTTSTGLSCGKTCCRSDSVTYDEHNSVKYGSVGAIDGVCCGGAIEEKQGDGFQHSTTTTTYRIENGAQGLKCLRSSSYADYHGTMFINSWTSTENYDGSYTTKECWGSGGTEASECYCSQSGGPSEKC